MKAPFYIFVLALPVSLLGFWSLPEGALTGGRIRDRAAELVSNVEDSTPVTVFDKARTAVEAVQDNVESAGKRYREFEFAADETKRLIRSAEKKLNSERDRLSRIDAMFDAGEPYMHPIVGLLSAEALRAQAELGLVEIAATEHELTGLRTHLQFIENLKKEVRNDAIHGPARLRQLQSELHLVTIQGRFQSDREQLVSRLGGTPRNLEELADAAGRVIREVQNEVSSMPTDFGRLDFPEIQSSEERNLDLRSRISAALGDTPPAVVAFDLR